MGIFSIILEKNKVKTEDKIAMSEQRTIPHNAVTTASNVRSVSVNIGIDFGTSYTKVAFTAGSPNEIFVNFQDSQFKESIIYYNAHDNSLYYNKPDRDSIQELRFFKHSILNSELRSNIETKTKTKPVEILVSVFFLACIIDFTKKYVRDYCKNKKIVINEGQWSITLGVPIDNYEGKNYELFKRILHIAEIYSEKLDKYICALNSIDDYYQDWTHKEIQCDSPLNTLPELYAETYDFLKDRNFQEGLYCLIDIGGGTVDIAVFMKQIRNDKDSYSIVAKIILPLGIEHIIHEISPGASCFKEVREYLYKDDTPLDVIKKDKEKEFAEYLIQSFAKMIMELKTKAELCKMLSNQKWELRIIFCGGGADYRWYHKQIEESGRRLRAGNIFSNNKKYSQKTEKTDNLFHPSRKINHRLLIARQLSQRYDDIQPLDGFPWHFQKDIPSEQSSVDSMQRDFWND